MSRSLYTGVARRRRTNREAAARVTAAMTGAPLAEPEPDPSRFNVVSISELPKARRKPGQPKLPALARDGPVLRLPGRQFLTQRRHLPPAAKPGLTALQAFLNTGHHGLTSEMMELVTADDDEENQQLSHWQTSEASMSRHHRRRIAQHHNWEDIIYSPQLYRLHLRHKYGPEMNEGSRAVRPCLCIRKRRVAITLVDLSGPAHSTVDICGCTSVAERLLPRGYFPCAPRSPSMAFSTALLDLISIHSLHVAPNTTAWARTLENFWGRRGPVKKATGSLRKRLGMSLTWYQVLDNRAETFVTERLPVVGASAKRPRSERPDDEAQERKSKRARQDLALAVPTQGGSETSRSNAQGQRVSRNIVKVGTETSARTMDEHAARTSTSRQKVAATRADDPEHLTPERSQESAGRDSSSRQKVAATRADDPEHLTPERSQERAGRASSSRQKVAAAKADDSEDSTSERSQESAGRASSSRQQGAAARADDSDTERSASEPAVREPDTVPPQKGAALTTDGGEQSPHKDSASDASGEELRRPSARLRRICPLCFGGDRPSLQRTESHVLVCIDANFAQKRRKSSQLDALLQYSGSRFAGDAEIATMEDELSTKRKAPSKKRKRGTAARVSDDVLDDCEQSFIAAQEGVTKASKNYYADTGLMALLCRHDRVLWMANLTTPGERQHYALALIRKLAEELPRTWNIGILYDIACQVHRSTEKWGLLPELDGRLEFAVSVFHAYGHQWGCQIVFHPRKRDGFGLTDGEGCERFWSAIRHLIAGLRVSGFHRRLFVLDRQVQALDAEGMWNLASWLRKRYQNTKRRLGEAQSILDACGESEEELDAQWKAQVAAQLEKLPRQSQSAADKLIEKILVQLGAVDDLRQELRDDRKRLRKVHKLSASETHRIKKRIEDTSTELDATQKRIDSMQASLGTQHARRLESLRGNEYLTARINARAVRANIRQSLVAHKFEHRKLERAYRHQVLQAKEHAQTKDLVHRRERNISSQVTKFNKLVDRMALLAKQGKKPPGRIQLPRKLEGKKLFKLDIDDDIWQEDPGLGPQSEKDLPRYLADPNVQRGMPALLEKRRCLEEEERLAAEAEALWRWWDGEERVLRSVRDDMTEYDSVRWAVQRRYDVHQCLRGVFEAELAYSTLGERFRPNGTHDVSQPVISVAPRPDLTLPNEGEDGAESTAVEDAYGSDDASDAYSDGDDEDEPVADWLDDLQSMRGSETEPSLCSDTDVAEDADGSDIEENIGVRFSTEVPQPDENEAAVSHSRAGDAQSIAKGASSSKTKPSKKRLEKRVRYSAGSFSCSKDDLDRMSQPQAWLSGDGLATFLENERRRLHVEDASIVHSATLFDVESYARCLKLKDWAGAEANHTSIIKTLRKLVDARTARKWLIMGHIRSPAHWTLIEVLWEVRTIRYYDSYSNNKDYAAELEEKTRLLLKLCEEHVTPDLDVETFTWVGEQRSRRQFNMYDCGPFMAADAVSLLTSEEPSPMKAGDMAEWRQTMERRVRALRTVDEIDLDLRKAENAALNAIEISD